MMTNELFAVVDITTRHEDFYGDGDHAYENHIYAGRFDEIIQNHSISSKSGDVVISFSVSNDPQFLFECLNNGSYIENEMLIAATLANGYEAVGDIVFVNSHFNQLYKGVKVERIYFFKNEEEMTLYNKHMKATRVHDHNSFSKY